MRSKLFLIALIFHFLCFLGRIYATTIHVSIDGKSGNDGTGFSKGYDFKTALGKVSPGDTILVQGGTHKISYNGSSANTINIKLAGSSSKWIYIIAENGKRATFDFQWKENSKVAAGTSISSYGFWFESSAKYLHFNRIGITHAGYQGIYVTGSHITFENCLFFDNWNTGVEVNKGGSYVTLLNCDSWGNNDSKYKNGEMADGFAVKQDIGPGNTLIGCRAWQNSDDGYDTYGEEKNPVLFERCWAFNNGYGSEADYNGFKIGGDNNVQKNILKNCISFGHKKKGFDLNSNKSGQILYNCVSYKNGTNYAFGGDITSGKHEFKNNIAIDGKVDIKNATQSHNSWNNGFSVNTSDFENLDLSKGSVERSIDGTIPETKLFRLKKSSVLIDAGIDVGIPFKGKKPDLGAFESEPPVAAIGVTDKVQKKFKKAVHSLQNNQLVISINTPVKNAHVSIYSLKGIKMIQTAANNTRKITVDCSSIPSGLYIYEFTTITFKQHMIFTK